MSPHLEYLQSVQDGVYPDDPRVPLDEPFVNANGSILNIITTPMTHAAIIESPAGALRANHWHKTDWHYAYVLEGNLTYYWRQPEKSPSQTHSLILSKGSLFFTPPIVRHAMFFVEKTRLLTFARNERSDRGTHESDLVREEIVGKKWLGKGLWEPFVKGL